MYRPDQPALSAQTDPGRHIPSQGKIHRRRKVSIRVSLRGMLKLTRVDTLRVHYVGFLARRLICRYLLPASRNGAKRYVIYLLVRPRLLEPFLCYSTQPTRVSCRSHRTIARLFWPLDMDIIFDSGLCTDHRHLPNQSTSLPKPHWYVGPAHVNLSPCQSSPLRMPDVG